MKTADKNELRVAVVKHLSVKYSIKVKAKIHESHCSTPTQSQVNYKTYIKHKCFQFEVLI